MQKEKNNRTFVAAEDWMDEDSLLLLTSWARDGYTFNDIANRIGINDVTLRKWRNEYEEIDLALRQGREIIDYKVENALLKAALGYKTKEVKVTTVIRGGKVIETIKENLTKEQAPSVTACQVWLYNRCQDKWKNMNSRSNMLDDLSDEANVEIKITRASSNAAEVGTKIEDADEINDEVVVRKMTKQEKKQHKEEIEEKRKEQSSKTVGRTDSTNVEDEWDKLEQEWGDLE